MEVDDEEQNRHRQRTPWWQTKSDDDVMEVAQMVAAIVAGIFQKEPGELELDLDEILVEVS